MDPEQLEKLAATADTVAAEHRELTTAIDAKHEQAAALLTAVVERIRPALPALASGVWRSYRSWWPTNIYNTDEHDTFKWRGLLVAGSGPEEDHPQSDQGGYEGGGLWLADDGRWYRVTYDGSWSRWQGADSQWEACADRLTVSQVVLAYDVDEIVTAITAALDSHVGRRAKATASATETAERLAALTTLF